MIEYSISELNNENNRYVINWKLFPKYLKEWREDKNKIIWFLDKLGDIRDAIRNEFEHYDILKSQKKELNKLKKKNKFQEKRKMQSSSATSMDLETISN